MAISRRNFVGSGALTAAGLVFRNLPAPSAFAEEAVQGTGEQQYGWPRKPEARVLLSFDEDWRFLGTQGSSESSQNGPSAAPGNVDIAIWNDAGWERVNLPHTVRLEPRNASGGRNYQGICWYQKHFASPSECVDELFIWSSRVLCRLPICG